MSISFVETQPISWEFQREFLLVYRTCFIWVWDAPDHRQLASRLQFNPMHFHQEVSFVEFNRTQVNCTHRNWSQVSICTIIAALVNFQCTCWHVLLLWKAFFIIIIAEEQIYRVIPQEKVSFPFPCFKYLDQACSRLSKAYAFESKLVQWLKLRLGSCFCYTSAGQFQESPFFLASDPTLLSCGIMLTQLKVLTRLTK